MNIFDLQNERSKIRSQLRRARAHLTDPALYYDLDDLAVAFRNQLDISARVAAPLVALAHGLAALGFEPAASAHVIGLPLARIEAALAAKIAFDGDAARALEAEIRAQLPASLLRPEDLAPQDRELARTDPESLLARG